MSKNNKEQMQVFCRFLIYMFELLDVVCEIILNGNFKEIGLEL